MTSLLRCRRGSVALEFALVALPLLTLLVGIVEMGVLMFEQAMMDAATRAAARQVRTGAVQGADDAATRFRAEFCANLLGPPCGEYSFDVRTFADFPQVALPPLALDEHGKPTDTVFDAGGAETVVVVRVFRSYRFLTPFLAALIGGSGGRLPLLSTAVMRTEPFE
ncbi:MAG: pilus assembly protein [Magnetospirillum sp.]|nr:pilus assembly protein [Magnetospirillum sp.]